MDIKVLSLKELKKGDQVFLREDPEKIFNERNIYFGVYVKSFFGKRVIVEKADIEDNIFIIKSALEYSNNWEIPIEAIDTSKEIVRDSIEYSIAEGLDCSSEKGYLFAMQEHEKKFKNLWIDIVKDTNSFIKSNGPVDVSENILFYNNIEKFADNLSLTGSWIIDRLRGINTLSDKKSLSRKVRKALGYNI